MKIGGPIQIKMVTKLREIDTKVCYQIFDIYPISYFLIKWEKTK